MLASLHLEQFRCHERLVVDGLKKVNIFLGNNGQGKSSLLEAIHLLSRCRSYRTAQMKDLVRWKTPGFSIEGIFHGEENIQKLKFCWAGGKRTLGVDGIEKATLHEFWGKCTTVIFKNSDLMLVQESGQVRRAWLDGLIASAEPGYLPVLQRFHNILRQRNALLRQPKPDRNIWEVLTDQLFSVSKGVTHRRKEYTQKLQPFIKDIFQHISLQQDEFTVIYQSDFEKNRETPRDALWERECRLVASYIGPQRDDWSLLLNEKPLRTFGSEGQQRAASLALRFAEVQLLHETRGMPPILLLDDVLHELDPKRVEAFWAIVSPTSQLFLATTRLTFDPVFLAPSVWNIRHSKCEKMS